MLWRAGLSIRQLCWILTVSDCLYHADEGLETTSADAELGGR
jgi:hypothetical protein